MRQNKRSSEDACITGKYDTQKGSKPGETLLGKEKPTEFPRGNTLVRTRPEGHDKGQVLSFPNLNENDVENPKTLAKVTARPLGGGINERGDRSKTIVLFRS